MNQKQTYVVATVVAFLMIAIVFAVPWRVQSSDELKWSPIFRQPISYVSSYEYPRGGSRYEYENGAVAFDIMLLEVLGLLLIGGALFFYFKNHPFETPDGDDQSQPAPP